MKKLFEPQSKPVSAVNVTPTTIATHFLAIPELVQCIQLPNRVSFYALKKSKTKTRIAFCSKIVFAKIKSPLDQFLKTQNTNNQNNNNSLDKGYINITDV